jgi:hypothetical protein
MASRPKPSSAHVHSTRLACCGLTTVPKRLVGSHGAWPAQRRLAACLHGPQASEAGSGAVPAQHSGSRLARSTVGGARTALHHCATGSERLRHEPRQGLHHEHPRRTDMVQSSSLKRGRRAMKGQSSPTRSTASELNDREEVT